MKPKLPQVAEHLLDRVIKRLEEQYLTLCTWGNADRHGEPASNRRFAIERHDQDKYSQKAIDVLIDAARDCLEWLVSNQVETAVRWCNLHVRSDPPLLRRLAVHGVSKREDLTASDKIDWLLTHTDLHESPIRREIFQAVRQTYPKASQKCRKAFIKAVWAYCWPNAANPDEEITARQHFDWFHWIHESDPNCALAKQALDAVLAKYPEFKPTQPPDLTRLSKLESPWPSEELLAKPAADWLDDLLAFQGPEWDGPGYSENHREYRRSDKAEF